MKNRFDAYVLGDYLVVGEIGAGGVASVLLASKHGANDVRNWTAIKRIHPHLAENDQAIRCFLDEARVVSHVSHENLAQLFDLGEDGGTFWVATEYVHGEPLREAMLAAERGAPRMSFAIASRVVADACEGLHAAHEMRGKSGLPMEVVHRNATPRNLFVTYEGTTKVVDLGLAKVFGRSPGVRGDTLGDRIAYLAPEQVLGLAIDRRVDIFALGVVLWELTTGRHLFCMDSDLGTLEKVLACRVLPPSTLVEGYPPDLEAIVLKALAKCLDERFQTAREFSQALHRFIEGRGAPVGRGEVATYVRSIFADRIRKREGFLRRATDLVARALSNAE
jgi:eukaryotic-like serine/threonine-protein kinase